MRLRHPDGSTVHLAYCTNVHAAEDLPGIHGQLSGVAARVRRLLGVERLGLGLWLSQHAAADLLARPGELAGLRERLTALGLEVVTLNGFPYRGFHDEIVKYRVYTPDWADAERLRYTLGLAEILAALLPDDVTEGTISTLPLAWRSGWTKEKAAVVRSHLDAAAQGLRALAGRTGKVIRLGFEPEPGCIVETTPQATALLSDVDHDHLGLCLDACHMAVGFEEPGAGARTGLPIVKLQASCALVAPPGALHDEPPPPLAISAPYLRDLLNVLLGGERPLTRHVEVETYTWNVLPGAPADVAEGIAAELDWMRGQLAALGLKET
ncbi:metabolite traffic protein EboE [Nonomuraea jabiensis]|uniref:metabolite traffic protein EboE n=1 Tax=Nonomuraea jabiensis TaxID=882448 RepID=UPI0034286162